MICIDDITTALCAYQPGADLELLRKAHDFSAAKHRGQARLSGDPYLSHPLEVAMILCRLRMDLVSVVTGLLHDTIEDTLTTEDELREQFGEEVARMVDGVTKISKIVFRTSQQRQAETFRKMLLAMARDIRVVIVKLADRLHNMRTLEHQPREGQLKIARETLDIYAPLANRLGISWIKSELEDLSFRFLEPEVFAELSGKVARRRKERDAHVSEIQKRLETILTEQGICGEVHGRFKHLYSVYVKMQRQGIDFDQVHDLVAFRIIVESVRDCYTMLGVIHSTWRPIPGRFKDYIAMPKANMYQSLHTTVMGPGGQRMEVQIRTADMHSIAEEGIAAHGKYKEAGGPARAEENRFGWLRQLLELQREVSDSDEFMSSVKIDLFPEQVYVFTPNGDVMELPRHSTPVDFAFSVHSDVGFRCSGAKVNGKLVPLKTVLHNGDSVEIMTSANQTPSKDWLKFVQTAKARNRIRHWVKEQERQKSLELGRDILEKELRKHGYSLGRALGLERMPAVLDELNYRNSDDLLAAVGYGKLTSGQVLGRLIPDQVRTHPERTSRIGQVLDRFRRKPSEAIRVQGLEGILVRFAKCCNPLPGDPVTGFISRGHGITVHAADCPRVLETDADRRIEVEWQKEKGTTRPAKIQVYSLDQKGVLAGITGAITKCEANILRASAYADQAGRGVHKFEVDVQDLRHLQQVMDAIRKVKGVQQVERVRYGRRD
ncbi:MAG: GTP pyrophosphokinase [Desulfuromonas sp.]|nr:MAG: GTP pyrophosphokinase [Desulfuromonas sp.]